MTGPKAMKPRIFCLSLFAIAMAGCGNSDFKNGQVTQLVFSPDGEKLLVLNEYIYGYGERKYSHSRLRSIQASDWKAIFDSGELEIRHTGISVAGAEGNLVYGRVFHRNGRGNPNGAMVFYEFDVKNHELKKQKQLQDAIGEKKHSYAIASAIESKRMAVVLLQGSVGEAASIRLIGLKPDVLSVELQDMPVCGSSEPPAGYGENTPMHSLLDIIPDCGYVASFFPCKPYRLQLHESTAGKLVRSLRIDSPAASMKYFPNGKNLAVLCWDGELLVIDPKLARIERRMQVDGLEFSRHAVVFLGNDYLAVIAKGDKIQIYDTIDWKVKHTFSNKNCHVNCLAASPSGKHLAAGFGLTERIPGLIRVWDITTGKLVTEFK